MGLSNKEFGRLVGCHFTTASRYRNGNRLPQVEILNRIEVALGIPHDELMPIWSQGAEAFGAWLRANVFADDGQEGTEAAA